MTKTANSNLSETVHFRIERCEWNDNNGQKYFHIQPKRDLTNMSKAMVGPLPGAHWNLEAMADILPEIEKTYTDNRRLVEMSKLGRECFELGAMMMGAV